MNQSTRSLQKSPLPVFLHEAFSNPAVGFDPHISPGRLAAQAFSIQINKLQNIY